MKMSFYSARLDERPVMLLWHI